MTDMIIVLRTALDIHVSGIPVAAHGDTLGPPMAPDAEFGVAKPIRTLIRSEGVKGWLKHNDTSCL